MMINTSPSSPSPRPTRPLAFLRIAMKMKTKSPQRRLRNSVVKVRAYESQSSLGQLVQALELFHRRTELHQAWTRVLQQQSMDTTTSNLDDPVTTTRPDLNPLTCLSSMPFFQDWTRNKLLSLVPRLDIQVFHKGRTIHPASGCLLLIISGSVQVCRPFDLHQQPSSLPQPRTLKSHTVLNLVMATLGPHSIIGLDEVLKETQHPPPPPLKWFVSSSSVVLLHMNSGTQSWWWNQMTSVLKHQPARLELEQQHEQLQRDIRAKYLLACKSLSLGLACPESPPPQRKKPRHLHQRQQRQPRHSVRMLSACGRSSSSLSSHPHSTGSQSIRSSSSLWKTLNHVQEPLWLRRTTPATQPNVVPDHDDERRRKQETLGKASSFIFVPASPRPTRCP